MDFINCLVLHSFAIMNFTYNKEFTLSMQDTKTRLNLSNPYFFWGLIIIFLLSVFFLTVNLNVVDTTVNEHKSDSSIVEQSYKDKADDKNIVVDLDNLNHMDFEKHQPSFNNTKSRSNITLLLLILYTIGISILFVYREKQNRVKLLSMEKIEDTIKIKLAEKEQKTYLYEHLKDDLEKHKDIIEPELKLDKIENELAADPRYIIINARVILEKTILKLYKYYFKEEATLNEMLQLLHRKRILSPALNNYAHTIKAFGNKAVHPSLNTTSEYKPKDALLVLNTLLQYLQDLKSANLPEK